MLCAGLISIAFFNFFGISVTKDMSAAHRMVLDSLRTLVRIAPLGKIEVWKCGSVEVWKCGSVEVWKCGSVEV